MNVKIFSLLYLVFISSLMVTAQVDEDFLESLSMRNIGPAGMSGRITAIDVNLRNDNIIYVGSASGGVWKTENGGITWLPIFDDEETQSIGSLKINQSNPDEIWVGTGEGNPRNSHNSGKGIYRSLDAGKTWTCMGLEGTKTIHRIHIDPSNPDIVFAGALGSAWGPSDQRGLYRTIDGGKNWDKILYVNTETGVADMIVDPSNPNKIIVAMWEFGRKPWTFNSGGKGSGVYRTVDGGKHWENLAEEDQGFPDEEIGRVGLAISYGKPNVVYALVEGKKQAIYRSDDGGYHWRKISDKNVGNRPFYYSEIYVDPSNENRIFNLWSYVSKSEDGGKTFETIMDYGNDVHPDHHAFWIHPSKANYMIDGNDGGLNISRDGGKNWRFISNLPVGQFYHVNVDNDYPYNVYGGMQDNGSWIGPGFALKRGGITHADWQELYFGDGFDVVPEPRDSRYGYAMSQQGHLAYYDRETGRTRAIQPAIEDTTYLRYNWNAPIALDPFVDCGVYFGSQFVHYSTDCGYNWETLSGDLTTNDKEKQKASLNTGGLTKDVTGAENHTTTLAMAASIHQEGELWVATDDGKLHKTTNRGKDWVDLSSKLPACPKNAWIPQISLSSINPDEAFVVVNNYRQNDWKPYLYHTTNGGASFTRIVNDGDVSSFVCSVVQDPVVEDLVFLGTDAGLYFSQDRGRSWEKWTSFPSVQIRDMVIQKEMDDLVLGTFGRAFWIMDDLHILRELTKEKNQMVKDSLHVFSAEAGYKNAYRSYQGMRFVAQGEYKGDNRSGGIKIPVWLLGDDEAEEEEEKKARVCITTMDGDTIRQFESKLKAGLNMINWGMDAKGYRGPSWSKPDEDKEPGGFPLAPGQYQAMVKIGKHKDSTVLRVNTDPRLDYEASVFDAKMLMMNEHKNAVEQATASFERLRDAKDQLDFLSKYVDMQVDSVAKEMNGQIKEHRKQIDSLQLLFLTGKDVTGYVSNKGKISPMIWMARRYISSSWDAPGSNAKYRLDHLKAKSDELNDAVDNYFETDWKVLKESIEALPIKLFDED